MRRLYDSYAGVLAGICARYITDADDQKDVLQESLIQIYTHISSFTYEGTEKLKPTIKLKVDDGEIAVLPFVFCLF